MSDLPAHYTAYVAGFLFSADLSKVLLIRKLKPAWQAGKLNGVGGKVEPGETPTAAMVREFYEEAGGHIYNWKYFASSGDPGTFTVDFFAYRLSDDGLGIEALQSQEEEKLEVVNVADIHPLREDIIVSVSWLIPLAIDHLIDGRPEFTEVSYSNDPARPKGENVRPGRADGKDFPAQQVVTCVYCGLAYPDGTPTSQA